MEKLFKKVSTLGFALIIVFGFSTVTYADVTYVGGELNRSGSLVQYDYVRTHTFDGPITLSIDKMPFGYLRLGLRNMRAAGGPQFTESLQWNDKGTKEWSDILNGTRFAFQGRMQATKSMFANREWGGNLTY